MKMLPNQPVLMGALGQLREVCVELVCIELVCVELGYKKGARVT